MDFSIGSFELNSLWKKPKNKRRFSLQQKICGLIGFTFSPKSSLYHFIQPIKESKRHRYHQLKFSIAVFFFSFSACIILVQLVRKVSKLKWWLDIWICVLKQTRTLLRLCGICAALVRSLCGFGCGRCTAIVQSVCDFSAAFVQFWCTIIRSLCDFGATSPSVRIYHKKKCT